VAPFSKSRTGLIGDCRGRRSELCKIRRQPPHSPPVATVPSAFGPLKLELARATVFKTAQMLLQRAQTIPRSITAFGFAGSLPQETLVVPALLAVWQQIWQRIQQTASTDTGMADLAPPACGSSSTSVSGQSCGTVWGPRMGYLPMDGRRDQPSTGRVHLPQSGYQSWPYSLTIGGPMGLSAPRVRQPPPSRTRRHPMCSSGRRKFGASRSNHCLWVGTPSREWRRWTDDLSWH
jgi:hypothetical protein